MRKIYLLPLLFLTIFLSGCSESGSFNPPAVNESKINVVTSFYPLFEIAERVGEPHLNATNLVPTGVEPHDYEPTPQDIIKLYQADLFIYNGGGFEPWSEKIVPELEKKGVRILSQADIVKDETIEEGEEHEEDGHEHGTIDPHFWLDPLLYSKQIGAVETMLVEMDQANEATYRQNAERFRAQTLDLDRRYREGLENCPKRTIVTSHNAFSYLARRYDLEIISIAGLSPESEPSAKTLAELTELVKKSGITHIFTESLLSPKSAETLANETGAKILVLNPLEGLTEEQKNRGENYLSIMAENLQNLRTALQCR